MPSSEPLIEIENLRLRVPETERQLFNGLTTTIDKGDLALVIGDTMSGKSWFVRLLCGMATASEGSVRLAGRELSSLSTKDGERHRRSIGVVSSDAPLLEDRDLWSNVVLPLEIDDALDGTGRHRTESLLRKLGLFELRLARPAKLSMSERQRTLLARALVREPLLLILDDPTIALNDEHTSEFARILIDESLRGMTILVATSDARLMTLLPQARRISLDPQAAAHADPVAL
jgi:cell division transport system ATP-binding protein